MFNVDKIKKDFPILNKQIDGKDLVYLDNAATSQKPQVVIDAVSDFYAFSNANVHRGIHTLSERATDMYEDARKKVADFIGARSSDEVVFTKGVTEAINMVATGWALKYLSKGDIILVVEADHHSNLVAWQVAADKTGAKLEVLQVDENGELALSEVENALSKDVKIVAISHASNVLGTIFPVKEICKMAKDVGAVVSVDGAQSIPHLKVNVQSLGCDFYSFSGHKMLGPMGIGALWGRKELLEAMTPSEYGGGMIDEVSVKQSTWAEVPQRFEAGTPNVAGAVGLAAAIDYLEKMGMDNIRKHEIKLIRYAIEELRKVSDLKILGPPDAEKRTGLVSFVIKGIHPHDIAAVLSEKGIAVRSGHHCAMPLHGSLGISSSTRASFYLYNDKKNVDSLIKGISEAKEILT